jgi:hypothetical protein
MKKTSVFQNIYPLYIKTLYTKRNEHKK